jgi:hypothetical protein
MFADIGHFSRPAIQLGFCVAVVSLTDCTRRLPVQCALAAQSVT